MRTRRQVLVVGGALAAAVAIVGTVMVATSGQPVPLPEGAISLPTSEWDGGPGHSAQVLGTVLRDEQGCLRAYQEPEVGLPILWPKGYYAVESEGTLIVHNEYGTEAVREGDSLNVAGGYGQVTDPTPGCDHLPADTEWAIIQSNVP